MRLEARPIEIADGRAHFYGKKKVDIKTHFRYYEHVDGWVNLNKYMAYTNSYIFFPHFRPFTAPT